MMIDREDEVRPNIRLSVSTRVTLLLAFGFLVGLVAAAVIMSKTVWPNFVNLEREMARRDVAQVLSFIDTESEALSTLTGDWANWDDTYAFMADRDQGYIQTNLPDQTFIETKIDAIVFIAPDGEVVWGRITDHDSGTNVVLPELPLDRLPAGHPLMAAHRDERPLQGFLRTAQGAMMVSANPIRTSEIEGPSRGVLIMGRFFDAAHIAELNDKLDIATTFTVFDPAAPPPEARDLAPATPMIAERVIDGNLLGHAVLGDVAGAPLALIEIRHPAEVTGQGAETLLAALGLVSLDGALVFLIVWLVMRRQVVDPLRRLTAHIVRLGEGGARIEGLPGQDGDEFAVVAHELNRMQRRLLRLAHHDPLTDLPNRALFFDRVEHAVAVAEREEERAAVLFIDLDGFKQVNDAIGHAAGDELLRQVARRLEGCVRKVDTVSRLGGDEFTVVISPVEDMEGIVAFCDKLVRTLAEPYAVEGGEAVLTASIGVALYPDHGSTPEVLVRAADVAMYEAKTAGRDGYRVYQDMMRTA